MAQEPSRDFVSPQLQINGLHLQQIFMDRGGHVHFGCISVHIDDFPSVTDQQILDASGPEALAWWTEWKDVLTPLFQKMATAMDNYWENTPDGQIKQDVVAAELSSNFIYQHYQPRVQNPRKQFTKGAKKPPKFANAGS